jgi:hypothetical protein
MRLFDEVVDFISRRRVFCSELYNSSRDYPAPGRPESDETWKVTHPFKLTPSAYSLEVRALHLFFRPSLIEQQTAKTPQTSNDI